MEESSTYIKKILDTSCGIAFFLASFASKAKYLPLSPLTPVAILFSLFCYLAGYSLWLTSGFFSPDQLPEIEGWYGFASFKEQVSYAAFLGIVASLVAIASLAVPPLSVLSVWLFFASNTFWSIGEYHKYKNPAEDTTYSASAQKSFLYYALSITLIGFVSAASLTLIIFFPPLVIPIGIFSVTLSAVATASALTYWYDYAFGNHYESKSFKTENIYPQSPAVIQLGDIYPPSPPIGQNAHPQSPANPKIKNVPPQSPAYPQLCDIYPESPPICQIEQSQKKSFYIEPIQPSSLFSSPRKDRVLPEDQTFSCLSSM